MSDYEKCTNQEIADELKLLRRGFEIMTSNSNKKEIEILQEAEKRLTRKD
jgi:hypothetical protein